MYPTRLLCPWDFPGKTTGVGCHSLLQGIFLAEGLNLGLLHCRWILHHLNHQGSPCIYYMYLHMDYINIYSFVIYICAYVYIFDTYVNTLFKLYYKYICTQCIYLHTHTHSSMGNYNQSY